MKSVKSRSLTMVVVLGMLFVTASPAAASPLTYHGGSVVRNPQVRVVFWGSNWNQYPGAREQIQGFFSTLSGSNYQGIFTQYYDTGGFISPNVGFDSWTDQSIAAPNNVNWLHIEEEIQYAIGQRGWPGGGINNVYMVLPAPGSKYQAGFILGCASHYYSSLVGSPMAYVGWPGDPDFKACTSYDPGKQDRAWAAASVTSSHEYAEAVTDPVTKKYAGTFTGWITEEGEDEIADKCAYMGGGVANGFYVSYLWDNSQNQCTLSHPGTSTWPNENLGGSITGDPAISSAAPNQLELFARGGDGALWHRHWDGTTWSGWVSLGGALASDSGPGTVSWSGNRVDVVYRGTDNGVWQRAWGEGSNGGVPISLGGYTLSDPAISSKGKGQLQVFVRGADNALWTKSFSNGSWSGWETLGGQITSGPGAVSWSNGRTDVVARGTDNGVWHWYWENGSWHLETIGGSVASDPAISTLGVGTLDVFARGWDNALWHQSFHNGGWWGWETLQGTITSGPGAVSWGSQRTDVVARATDWSVQHSWWSP